MLYCDCGCACGACKKRACGCGCHAKLDGIPTGAIQAALRSLELATPAGRNATYHVVKDSGKISEVVALAKRAMMKARCKRRRLAVRLARCAD